MTALPILSSIYATEAGDFETAYPCNMEPVAQQSGVSSGHLRTAMGAETWVTGPGIDRGGINWNGTLYRVMGSLLVQIAFDGSITTIGDVGSDGFPVRMDYGFGRLAINSANNLWYYDGTTLAQVTDTDLGPVLDMVWMDGYYVTTDGTSIIVTDLSDPFSVNPLKYGSAEADPDMVTGLIATKRGELVALGQYTIEFYQNAGTSGFPFQVSPGATIPIGCVGRYAKCEFVQSFAFVGGGENQAIGVWIAGQGSASKISTRAIDDLLADEPNKASIQLEVRVARDENRLYVHLSDRTLVYLAGASSQLKQPIWYTCASGIAMDRPYRLRNAVNVYDKLICGDTEANAIGIVSESLDPGDGMAFLSWSFDGEAYSQEYAQPLGKRGNRAARPQWRPHLRIPTNYAALRFRGDNAQPHFGELTGWEFGAGFVYNDTKGAILHDIELVGLPGRAGFAVAACEVRAEALAV